MGTVHAVFENGVFRPSDPVALPEGCEVEFDPRIVGRANGDGDSLPNVYEILRGRFDSGEPDVSARHNEHQP
ncbi:MAG: antitoxin family protein [Planctomycetota bacterium]